MHRNRILKLVETFAVESGFPIDHYHLHGHKFKYEDELQDGYASFYSQLLDVSEFAHFNLQQRLADPEEFCEIVKQLDFPIIVFKTGEKSLEPILIKHRKGKHIDAISISDNNELVEVFVDEKLLLKKIKTYGEMVQDHACAFGNPEDAQLKQKIFFISGFKIESQMSIGDVKSPSPVKRLFQLFKSEKKDIYTLYFFAIMIALVNLALPLGIQAIVGLMSGGLLLESVFVLMFMVILATLVSGWLQVQQLGIVEVLQQRIFAKTAFDFAFRIPKLKLENLSNHYTPELINRFFDVLNVQKSLPKILIDFVTAIIQIVFGLLLLSFYHYYFIFFGLLVLLVIFLVFYFTSKKGLETSIYESKYKYKVVYWLEELGRSAQSFKLAGNAVLPLSKMDRLLEKYISYRKKHFKVLVVQFSAIIAFKTLITAGLLILGGALVFQEQINLGQFVASEIIIVLVINSVEKLIGTISVVYDILTAVDKIGQVTDLDIEHNAGREVGDLDIQSKFELELVNLSYKYSNANGYSFKDVSFNVSNGEKICITGFNDSGKTTLIKTIAGLQQNYEGLLKLNGISIREININSYRGMIGNNLNLTDVFEGTIEENITMGRTGILLKDILHAVHLAGLEPFISGLKEGLQTEVQPAGENFPTNVVKKILLARSFVIKPKMLLIDEFFHNVNTAEKQVLLQTLFAGDYALIIVSTLPEIMKRCDKIIVLKEGGLFDMGTYSELDSRKSLPVAY